MCRLERHKSPNEKHWNLSGEKQLLAMAIRQIETTGIEPVSHDIGYHCSTTELSRQKPTIAMLKSDFLSTHGRWNSRRRIRTAVSMDMSHVRFRFSILPEPGRTGLAIGLSCYAFHYPVFFICGTHTGNPGGFLITVVCSTSIFMHNFNGLWFASFENSFNQRALR